VTSRAPAADRRAAESGATLIEVLVAVVIMGLAFVIIVGGIGIAIIGSETQKERAATDVALRTAAETIDYAPCPADAAAYAAQLPTITDFTLAVTRVSYWNRTANTFEETCPTPDAGLHLIELRATPTSGRTRCKVDNVGGPATCEPLQIVKRRPS
jgi:Tfp pilus assembly protein PilV